MYTVNPKNVVVQNPALSNFICDSYDLAKLSQLKDVLVSHNALTLHRYGSGGASAVTIVASPELDNFVEALLKQPLYEETLRNQYLNLVAALPPSQAKLSLGDSISGLLCNMWDRDNIMQAIGELSLLDEKKAIDPAYGVNNASWKRGLLASLKHHYIYQNRFIDMIDLKVSGYAKDFGKRPNIRYNAVTLAETPDPWGHAQNDSLAFVSYLLFYALNRGFISFVDSDLQPMASAYICLQHAMFETIQVWHDSDLGAWEDTAAVHASSIMVVVASLREQLKFLRQHGPVTYNIPGHNFVVTVDSVEAMLNKCLDTLKQVLPNEFVTSANGAKRTADLAFLNPLLLAYMSGEPILSDDVTLTLLNEIESNLLGPIAIGRYAGDVWDGRVNRYDLGPHEIAQWCHGNAMMSSLYGMLYRKTNNQAFYEKQVWYFNRTIASVTKNWLIPEAYIVDVATRTWVPDANEPLAWATSMTIKAFGELEASIKHSQNLWSVDTIAA